MKLLIKNQSAILYYSACAMSDYGNIKLANLGDCSSWGDSQGTPQSLLHVIETIENRILRE